MLSVSVEYVYVTKIMFFIIYILIANTTLFTFGLIN